MAHFLAINPTYRIELVNFSLGSSAGTNMRYNSTSTITGRAVFNDGTTAPIALLTLTASSGSISGNIFTPPYLEIGANALSTLDATCIFGDKIMSASLTISVSRPRMTTTWTVGAQYQGSPGITYVPITLNISGGSPNSVVEYELYAKNGEVIYPRTYASRIDANGNLNYNHISPSAAGLLKIKTYVDSVLEREDQFPIESFIIGVPNSGAFGDSASLCFNNCPANVSIYFTYNNPAGPVNRTNLGAMTDRFGAAQFPVTVGFYPGGSWTATFYSGDSPTVIGTNTFTWLPKIVPGSTTVTVGSAITLIGHNLPTGANVQYSMSITSNGVYTPPPPTPPGTAPVSSLGEWGFSIPVSKVGIYDIDIFINGGLYGRIQVNVV